MGNKVSVFSIDSFLGSSKIDVLFKYIVQNIKLYLLLFNVKTIIQKLIWSVDFKMIPMQIVDECNRIKKYSFSK